MAFASRLRSNVRAFLEYILPAGSSSAINITRRSNPPSNMMAKGWKTTGDVKESERESNSVSSQPVLIPVPLALFPNPCISPFRPVFWRLSFSDRLYIYLCLSFSWSVELYYIVRSESVTQDASSHLFFQPEIIDHGTSALSWSTSSFVHIFLLWLPERWSINKLYHCGSLSEK